ncbi:MAG: hypothetical protein ABI832_21795 [bacterium]
MPLIEHLNQATLLASSGDLGGAVQHYEHVLTELFARGAARPADAMMLADVGRDLTELLHWHRRYDEAIDLMVQLAAALPDQATEFGIKAANLQIENGDVDEGLAALTDHAQSLDDAAAGLLMGTAHLWLNQTDDALLHLRSVYAAPAASPDDRATAAQLMFQIQAARQDIPAAVVAWTQARALDGLEQENLPELIGMLIYWYQYAQAEAYVPQLASELQRSYFRTILASKTAALPSRHDWAWIHDHDPATLTNDHDDYAEAALRGLAPDLALAVVMPRIEAGEMARRSLVLAGLAFAQQRDIGRAKWALDQGLRLADLERPRRTRPGAGTARIFDAPTRMLYGDIPLDNDIRALLDNYFMPKPPLH